MHTPGILSIITFIVVIVTSNATTTASDTMGSSTDVSTTMSTDSTTTSIMSTGSTTTSMMSSDTTTTSMMSTGSTTTPMMSTGSTTTSMMSTGSTTTPMMSTDSTTTSMMSTDSTTASMMPSDSTATSMMHSDSTATSIMHSDSTTTSGVSMSTARMTDMSTATERSMSPTTTTATTTTTTITTTTPTTTTTTTPLPPRVTEIPQNQESEFGRVGFVAFGITFAIAVILLITLIIILVRRRRKSGVYLTDEGNSPKRMIGDLPMSMPMNDSEFEHVQIIDLEKTGSNRNIGNGTGTSTFTTHQVQKEGATNASFLKHNDNGSVNNLLHEEDSDKEVSDDEESPATFIGLKVEPSAGASVESLEQLKETDKLVDNKSRSPSIDDNLPPPSLSSENGSQNSVPAINDSNEITEM